MSVVANVVIISLALMACITLLFFVLAIGRRETILNVTLKNITPLTATIRASNGAVEALAPGASYNVTLGDNAKIRAEAVTPGGVQEKFEVRPTGPSNQLIYLTLDGFKRNVYSGVELINTNDQPVIFAYVTRRGQRRYPVTQLEPNSTLSDVYVPHGSTWQAVSTDETPLAEIKVDKPLTKMIFNGTEIITQ